MAYAVTCAALAAVSIAGVGIGIQLGRAAISEINPIYFQELPPSRSFSDLSPNAPRSLAVSTESTASDRPGDLWTDDVKVGAWHTCLDCEIKRVDDTYADGQLSVSSMAADAHSVDEALQEPEPNPVSRYADLPTTQAAAAVDPDPQPREIESHAAEETPPAGM